MSQFFWAPGLTIKKMEEEAVANALQFYDKNEKSAAQSLGITVEELQSIVKRSQLAKEEQDKRDIESSKKKADFLARSRGLVVVDPKTNEQSIVAVMPGAEPGEGWSEGELAKQGDPRAVTPESALPKAPMTPTAGGVNDPLLAAKRTQMMMEENGINDKKNFPQEDV